MAAMLPLASTSLTTGAQGEIYFGLAKAIDVSGLHIRLIYLYLLSYAMLEPCVHVP